MRGLLGDDQVTTGKPSMISTAHADSTPSGTPAQAAASSVNPRHSNGGCRHAATSEEVAHIPYPSVIGPRDYHGRANQVVTLPGGISVVLAPVWRGSYQPCPSHPTGPVYFIPSRPVPSAADRIVLPLIGVLHAPPRRFNQAVRMLHRLADLPPAIEPIRPKSVAFAKECFPDRAPGDLSAAEWGHVRRYESAWVQSTYGPALDLYERRRSAIWTAAHQDL